MRTTLHQVCSCRSKLAFSKSRHKPSTLQPPHREFPWPGLAWPLIPSPLLPYCQHIRRGLVVECCCPGTSKLANSVVLRSAILTSTNSLARYGNNNSELTSLRTANYKQAKWKQALKILSSFDLHNMRGGTYTDIANPLSLTRRGSLEC